MKDRVVSLVVFVCFAVFLGGAFFLGYQDFGEKNLGGDFENVGGGQNFTLKYAENGYLWISPFGVQDKLVTWFAESKYSISFWLYRLTLKEIETALKSLSFLGIDIRWIGEEHPFEGTDKKFQQLKKRLENNGVEVKNDSDLRVNYTHSKAFISDMDRYLISTANLTYTSITKNREYWFAGSDEEIARNLSYLFEKDWNGEKIVIGDIHPALLFCPINCRKKLKEFLLSATESIYIQAQYIQDEEVISLLEEKAEDIPVVVLLGKWQEKDWFSNESNMEIYLLEDPYIHSKNVLVDEDVLLVGSMNFSTNGIDRNRETSVLVRNEYVTSAFVDQFFRDKELGILIEDRQR